VHNISTGLKVLDCLLPSILVPPNPFLSTATSDRIRWNESLFPCTRHHHHWQHGICEIFQEINDCGVQSMITVFTEGHRWIKTRFFSVPRN